MAKLFAFSLQLSQKFPVMQRTSIGCSLTRIVWQKINAHIAQQFCVFSSGCSRTFVWWTTRLSPHCNETPDRAVTCYANYRVERSLNDDGAAAVSDSWIQFEFLGVQLVHVNDYFVTFFHSNWTNWVSFVRRTPFHMAEGQWPALAINWYMRVQCSQVHTSISTYVSLSAQIECWNVQMCLKW